MKKILGIIFLFITFVLYILPFQKISGDYIGNKLNQNIYVSFFYLISLCITLSVGTILLLIKNKTKLKIQGE